MNVNRLKLNKEKTTFILFGAPHQLSQIDCQNIRLCETDIAIASETMCLGVLLDSTLTFAPHVRRLAGRCFYHLRQLRTVRRSLTDDSKTMAHSFVINRIDYCNNVLYGMSVVHMRPLQNVLNSAARVVMKMSKFQHITAAVRDQLHCMAACETT